jgi:hypothetical protein
VNSAGEKKAAQELRGSKSLLHLQPLSEKRSLKRPERGSGGEAKESSLVEINFQRGLQGRMS